MCKIDTSFKLCSCSGHIDRTKPHWVLERMNINMKDVERVLIGHFPFEHFINEDKILEEMNARNVFDFDYKPKQKDTLSLYFEEDFFHLIYTNGKWREFFMYPGLREAQKDLKQEGVIG